MIRRISVGVFVYCACTSAIAQEISKLNAIHGVPLATSSTLFSVPDDQDPLRTSGIFQATFSSKEKVGAAKFVGPTVLPYTRLTIGLEAPFDSEVEESVFSDFDGLTNTAAVSVGLSGTNLKASGQEAVHHEHICKKHSEGLGVVFLDCTANEIKKLAEARLKALQGGNDEEKKQAEAMCHEKGLSAACKPEEFGQKAMDDFLDDDSLGSKQIVSGRVWNVELEIGKKKYKYRDLESFEKREFGSEPFRVSAGVGHVRKNSMYGVGFAITKSYESADSRELCSGIGEGLEECFSGAFGPPSVLRRENVYLEWRYAPVRTFAISPKFILDTKSGEAEFHLPIYVVSVASRSLSGGVRFKWNTEEQDLVGEVFIGKSFRLFD